MEALRLPARHRRLLLPVLIGLFLAVPAVAVADHVFGDVPDDATHADGIHYVAEAGITSGCTAENYCPGANLTRGQMATFLHRSSGNAAGVAASVNAASVAADGIVTVSASNTVEEAVTNQAEVTCPEGTVVVGGGGSVISNQWVLQNSRPIGTDTWRVLYRNVGVPSGITISVVATCLRVGP